MQIVESITEVHSVQSTVLTVGVFDGIHLGHQRLIGDLVAHARECGAQSALVALYPRPIEVLAPDKRVAYLTTLGERALLLEKLGLDLLIIEHFTLEVAHTSARDFVRQLIDHLRMVELWVGPDFALGYQRQGNVAALKKLGAELSFEVHLIEPIRLDDMIISSTRIRSLLAEGDITAASRLLGRRPALHGKIVATMAPSDMELAVEPGLLIPASGWYSAWVDLGNERRTATAELVNDEARSIWLHLAQPLDVAMGQELRIELVKRLETGTSDFTAAEDLVYRRERGER